MELGISYSGWHNQLTIKERKKKIKIEREKTWEREFWEKGNHHIVGRNVN